MEFSRGIFVVLYFRFQVLDFKQGNGFWAGNFSL